MKVYRTDIIWDMWSKSQGYFFGSIIGWDDPDPKFLMTFRTSLTETETEYFDEIATAIFTGDGSPFTYWSDYLKRLFDRAKKAKCNSAEKIIWRIHKENCYATMHSLGLVRQEFPNENLIATLEASITEVADPKKTLLLTLADSIPDLSL